MWTGISHRIKYESSPNHKTVYDYTIPYPIMLIITGPKMSKNSKNEWINLWPEPNLMILGRMIMNVWIKWAMDFGRKESQSNNNVGFRLTKYKNLSDK